MERLSPQEKSPVLLSLIMEHVPKPQNAMLHSDELCMVDWIDTRGCV